MSIFVTSYTLGARLEEEKQQYLSKIAPFLYAIAENVAGGCGKGDVNLG
jgi:hypothetical protein